MKIEEVIIIIELIFHLQDRYEKHCPASSTCICRTCKLLCECAWLAHTSTFIMFYG